MKSLQITKLIELLRSTNQTHIEIPDLISLYESTTRSDLVAESIYKIHKTLETFKPRTPVHVYNEANIARHLLDYVPKINYGRRFGHTFGLAKYILEESKRNRSHRITVVFPSSHLVCNFTDALKSICSPQQLTAIVGNLNVVSNSFKLTQHIEETDTLIIADFFNSACTTSWLESFGCYLKKDKKIIIVGDYLA